MSLDCEMTGMEELWTENVCVCVFSSLQSYSEGSEAGLLLLVTVDECGREPCSQAVISQVCLSVKPIRVFLL